MEIGLFGDSVRGDLGAHSHGQLHSVSADFLPLTSTLISGLISSAVIIIVTKSDAADIQANVKAVVAGEIKGVNAKLSSIETDIKDVKAELKAAIKDVNARLNSLETADISFASSLHIMNALSRTETSRS